MANQQIWVHGHSGQLHVLDERWGDGGVDGVGLYLNGKTYNPPFQNVPYLHFHIPMSSFAIEGVRHLPKLKKVMLRFSTDCNPDADLGYTEREEYYRHYKYIRDFGGAWISEVHVYDGETRRFGQNVQWQSPSIHNPIENSVPAPQDFEIHTGLGVTVRVKFKNQMRLQKWEATFQGEYGPVPGSEHQVEGYEPEEEPTNRTLTKSAIIHAVGCDFVPAQP